VRGIGDIGVYVQLVAGDAEDRVVLLHRFCDRPRQFPGAPGSGQGIGIVNADIDRADQLRIPFGDGRL
jgi:hypothetical protein